MRFRNPFRRRKEPLPDATFMLAGEDDWMPKKIGDPVTDPFLIEVLTEALEEGMVYYVDGVKQPVPKPDDHEEEHA